MRQQQPYSESKVNEMRPMASQMTALAYSHGQPISQYQLTQQQPGLYQAMQSPIEPEAYQDTQMQVTHSAAFDEAFAEAEDAYTSEQGQLQPDLSNEGLVAGVRLDPIFTSQHSALQQSDSIQNDLDFRNPAIRIGSDMIPQTDHEAPRTSEQISRDHDELARTAGQLVNSVSGDKSSKFENSQFLSLMRKLRDRQVEVRGEDFHDIDKNASIVPTRVLEDESALASQSSLPYPPPSIKEAQSNIEEDYLTERQLRRDKTMQRPSSVLQEWNGEMTIETQDEVQALHPGGRGYPVRVDEDEDRHKYDHWASGGIGVEDERSEGSDALTNRFRRVTVEDHHET
jgi:hypothetical protein